MRKIQYLKGSFTINKIVLLLILLTLLILNIIILKLRISSIIDSGEILFTSGVEGPGIFNIWKVINNYNLYDNPYTFPFNIAIYNYLFYYSYGYIFKLFSLNNSDIMTWGRFVTLVFSLLGFFFQSKLLLFITNVRRYSYEYLSIIILTFLLWFGTGATSWWILTIRPDIPAAALTIVGLYLYIINNNKSIYYLIISSILFYMAWSFKQNYILIFFSLLLYECLYIQIRRFLYLLIPFIFLCFLTFFYGGDNFNLNFFATSGHPLGFNILMDNLKQTLFLNPFYWFLAPLFFFVNKNYHKFNSYKSVINLDSKSKLELLLILLSTITFLFSLIFASKWGSSRNHFYESLLITGSLSIYYFTIFINSNWKVNKNWAIIFSGILILLIVQCLLPILQTIYPNNYGKQTLLSNSDYIERIKFNNFVTNLPKPIFSTDNFIALPWNSGTDNRNSSVLDYPHYFITISKGYYTNENLFNIIDKNIYNTIILTHDNVFENLYELALENGYKDFIPPKDIIYDDKIKFLIKNN